MTKEFQVLYRHTQYTGTISQIPIGPVLSVDVKCHSSDLARHQFESAGLAVVGINYLRNVVDWDKPNFDLDEAGAYCCVKGATFSKNKGDGETPWVSLGNGFVPKSALDKYILDHANEPARRFLKELPHG